MIAAQPSVRLVLTMVLLVVVALGGMAMLGTREAQQHAPTPSTTWPTMTAYPLPPTATLRLLEAGPPTTRTPTPAALRKD